LSEAGAFQIYRPFRISLLTRILVILSLVGKFQNSNSGHTRRVCAVSDAHSFTWKLIMQPHFGHESNVQVFGLQREQKECSISHWNAEEAKKDF
jgi:hypothetical protein